MHSDGRIEKITAGPVEFVAWSAVFALVYTQLPLFNSNQFQYFLHGMAQAGYGFLSQDWLARTADPTPVFSALVNITFRIFHSEAPVYVLLRPHSGRLFLRAVRHRGSPLRGRPFSDPLAGVHHRLPGDPFHGLPLFPLPDLGRRSRLSIRRRRGGTARPGAGVSTERLRRFPPAFDPVLPAGRKKRSRSWRWPPQYTCIPPIFWRARC